MPRRIKCPYCGAEFEAPSGFSYVVCPYCGTTIRVDTGEAMDTYTYPVRVEEQEAYYLVVSRASQLPAAPSNIAEESSYVSSTLHYVPLYVCRARARAPGCEGAEEEEERAFPAAPDTVPGFTDDYQFPAAGRSPFDPATAKRGVFHQVSRGHTDKCRELRLRVAARAEREARLARCTSSVESGSELIGLAHYPVWLVKYRHPAADKALRGLVDAVDANVVYVEYPIPSEKRAEMTAAAATAIGVSIVIAVAATTLARDAAFIASWLPGIGAAIPFLRKTVSRIGRELMRRPRVEKVVITRI